MDVKHAFILSIFFFTLKNGYSQTYIYDDFNRLSQTTYPNGTQITYVYDKLGNRVGHIITEAPIIPGCTDPQAHNHNPDATEDDGSCQTCNDGLQNGDETGIDCGGQKCEPCGSCTTDTATINDDPIPDNTTVAAADWIESAGTIEPGSTVSLQAANYIKLLPGFHARNSSEVTLRIADCNAPTARLVASPPKPLPPPPKSSLGLFPNPASYRVNIVYELHTPQRVNIVFRSLSGQEVKFLVRDELKEPGKWNLEIDGSEIPAGTYVVFLETEQERISRKLVIIRY